MQSVLVVYIAKIILAISNSFDKSYMRHVST